MHRDSGSALLAEHEVPGIRGRNVFSADDQRCRMTIFPSGGFSS